MKTKQVDEKVDIKAKNIKLSVEKGELVLVLAKRPKRKDTTAKLYKSIFKNKCFFKRGKMFLVSKKIKYLDGN